MKKTLVNALFSLALVTATAGISFPVAASTRSDLPVMSLTADYSNQQWQSQPLPGATGMVLASGTDISDIVITGNSSVLYVVDSHLAPGNIYRSNDGGETFFPVNIPPVAASLGTVAVAPDDPENLAATDRTSGSVFISSNSGGIWTALPALPPAYSGASIRTLVVGPAQSGMLYGRQYLISLSDPTAGSTARGDILIFGPTASWTSVCGAITGTLDYLNARFTPNSLVDHGVVVTGVGTAPGSAAVQILNAATGTLVRTALINPLGTTTDWAATLTGTSVSSMGLAMPSDFDPTTALGRRGYVAIRSGPTAAPVPPDNDVYRFDDSTVTQLWSGIGRFSNIPYDGTLNSGTLFVGAGDSVGIRYTTGMTGPSPVWTSPAKLIGAQVPTGINTRVRLAIDFATSHKVYAGFTGPESALCVSTDGGFSFNQESLIDYGNTDNTVGTVNSLTVSQDGGTVFMATKSATGTLSLWKSTAPPTIASWARIFAIPSVSTNDTPSVKLPPDFLTSANVYFFDCTTNGPFFRSINGGATFVQRLPPTGIAYAGSTTLLTDASTLFMGDTTATPYVYRSDNGGWTWSTAVPANITGPIRQINSPKTNFILVGGVGYINYSSDGGATFPVANRITGPFPGESYRVVAGSAFASDNTLFAADASGTTGNVYRHVIGSGTGLVTLHTPPIPNASVRGLVLRKGVLYVQYGSTGNNVTYRSANPWAGPGNITWTTLPTPAGVTGALGINSLSASAPDNIIWATDNIGVWAYTDILSVNIALIPASSTVNVGSTFDVVIQAEAGAIEVAGVDAFLNFDANKLAVVDMDSGNPGIQITPGTALNTVLTNNSSNTLGTIDFAAGKLGGSLPAGTFTVATARFQALAVTALTSVIFSTAGGRKTEVTDGVIVVTGTLTDAAVQIVSGTVDISVLLQGGSRPVSGWVVPMTIKFFTPGADVMTAMPVYTFNLTTAKAGVYATAQCSGVLPGNYDITAVSEHTLLNVKRNVIVIAPSNTVNLGTLLEGNANNNDRVNILDFGILATAYGKSKDKAAYNPAADFDRNDIVNIFDFGLLATNYLKMAPIEVP